MAAEYDATAITAYFDEFAENEWDRLARSPEAEVNFAVHLHYLDQYVPTGARVLEIGCGAGRFTIELARRQCQVVAADISSVQLEINREKVSEAGFEPQVEGRHVLDIVDMPEVEDESFDAVVAYGGPFSYAMNRRFDALKECVRVARPGAPILSSVMSLWGSVHKGLNFVLTVPREANDQIIATGDITSDALPGHRHYCHAFRSAEFRAFLEQAGLEVSALSAATSLTTSWGDRLAEIRRDPDRWDELIQMEIAACASEGCIETGPHIIGVASKPVRA